MAEDPLTPEQRERMEQWIRDNCGSHQYGEQDENGVDLSLIRANLKLTPEERLLQGDRARRGAMELLEYGRRYEEKRSAEARRNLAQARS